MKICNHIIESWSTISIDEFIKIISIELPTVNKNINPTDHEHGALTCN